MRKLLSSLGVPSPMEEARKGITNKEGNKVSWKDSEKRTTTRRAFGSLSGS